MRVPNRRRLWLLAPAAILLALAIQSCVAPPPEGGSGQAAAPEKPYPTVNHEAHLARDLECIDCHDPDETNDPKLPVVETCFDCHDAKLAGEPEAVQAYFASIRQEDGSYRFRKLAFSSDLIMSHPTHLEYEVECAQCHGEPSAKAFGRPALMDLKSTCLSCHKVSGASVECSVCHKAIRQESPPASHAASGFQRAHGAQAPAGWRQGTGGLCALCHQVPADCETCHQESKPSTHLAADWRFFHGRGDTDAFHEPFDESSCALCHAEQGCVLCHQTTRPRSHTVSFERRLHGVVAEVERQSCMTCHKQDQCSRCHQTTKPVSHRGTFASGPQAHCIGCHEPLQSTGCYACHKNTLGHLQATPLPPGPPHDTATDCESCHTVLPHFNDGGDCRRCHR